MCHWVACHISNSTWLIIDCYNVVVTFSHNNPLTNNVLNNFQRLDNLFTVQHVEPYCKRIHYQSPNVHTTPHLDTLQLCDLISLTRCLSLLIRHLTAGAPASISSQRGHPGVFLPKIGPPHVCLVVMIFSCVFVCPTNESIITHYKPQCKDYLRLFKNTINLPLRSSRPLQDSYKLLPIPWTWMLADITKGITRGRLTHAD